jgi:hypothetical protein
MVERNSIEVQTLEKIKKFLSKQKVPVYKGFIVKELGVNLDSLNYALKLIPHQEDHFGRIKSFVKSRQRDS